tara:strand:+ start:2322 stop:3584 length:1263 start_codon:yes stop_codon:yes gene_type:complete
MSFPELTPSSKTSASILPSTGSVSDVSSSLAINYYGNNDVFRAGAAAQVAFTYKRLGGDVLDIELKAENIYNHYEEAVLEYSYIINLHQARNSLGSALGGPTGSFDEKGGMTSGSMGLSGSATKYPKFKFDYAYRVADKFSTEATVGGVETMYSSSFSVQANVQDYNIQAIVETSASQVTDSPFYGIVGNKRIKVRQVYYVSPRQMWRFYGYYGGLNVTGDMHNYGQYSDDSTFEVIPAWQNKAQAISYEDHLYTRTSHYSYELINNNLRLFPIPSTVSPAHIWFRFTIENNDAYATGSYDHGLDGVNNVNSLPFTNLPFQNINSMGQQWIRKFSLSLSKETLGQIRGKFGNSIPIPGDNVSLNASDLLSQAASEQAALKEELNKQLDEMLYSKIAETDKAMADNVNSILTQTPMKIFVG